MENVLRFNFVPEALLICFHGISIRAMAWAIFLFAIVCFIITYLHVILLLEMKQFDPLGVSNYDYIDIPDLGPIQDEMKMKIRRHSINDIRLGEEASEGLNIIKTKILDPTKIEIGGWWMPDARWNAHIDCKSGFSNICKKVLSVTCDASKLRTIYQFLPINPSVKINGLVFTAASKAPKLKPVANEDLETTSIYSAIAYLKYKNGTHSFLRLDFIPGTHSETRLREDITFETTQQLDSVTLMLTCQGYIGMIQFFDIKLFPIVEGKSTSTHQITDLPCLSTLSKASTAHSYKIEPLILERVEIKRASGVTIVTQVSMENIQVIQNLLEVWKHPISAAVFIPPDVETEKGKAGWKNLYLRKKLSEMKFPEFSGFYSVKAASSDELQNSNFLRNFCLSKVKTEYVFLMDAVFLPSPDLEEEFLKVVSYLEDTQSAIDRIAFVVPALEMIRDVSPPLSKEEVKKLMSGENPSILSYILQWITAPDAHRPTNYRQWMRAEEPYQVQPYHNNYEPFIIVKKSKTLPVFDERFTSEPFDRLSYTMELHSAGYSFMVLPNSWIIRPFVVPITPSAEVGLYHQIEQYHTRFEFIADLVRNYKLGMCSSENIDVEPNR